MGEGFKAHGAGLGPKLGAGLASGATGLQRRVDAARARQRAAVEAERRVVQVATPLVDIGGYGKLTPAGESAAGECNLGERGGGEQGTSGGKASVKPAAGVSTAKKRGRPRVEGLRPWEFEGVSRRTWERRRKKGGGDG